MKIKFLNKVIDHNIRRSLHCVETQYFAIVVIEQIFHSPFIVANEVGDKMAVVGIMIFDRLFHRAWSAKE